MAGVKGKSGNKPKSLYHYQIQVLKWIIVWEWEEIYWGNVSFETKQRYLRAKHQLKKKTRER